MSAKARLRGIGFKMAEQFRGKNVPWLKDYLTKRGIQVSDQGRGKRKAELVELAEKACRMKLPKIDEEEEDLHEVIDAKLETEKGRLPRPDLIQNWTYDFASMPQFTFADLYTYLVGSGEEYTAEKLKSFKSLQGYKLFADGHVQDCAMYKVKDMEHSFFRFKVIPTERSKTDTNKATYDGFVILENSGVVKGGFCPCKGGLDGTCRHVAAVLFDLEHTARINDLKSCTSGQCQWIRRAKPNTNCCLLQDLKLTKSEYGKQEKTCPTVTNFEPRSRKPDPDMLCKNLRDGLQKVCSSAVALHVLPCPQPNVNEDMVHSYISAEQNVECFEEVEAVEIFTVSEVRDTFVSTQGPIESVDTMQVSQFFDAIAITQKQADMINEKTKDQGQTDFWSKQRTGRLTGSNFYRICHLRESTNKDNTLKDLLNYRPLPPEKQPEQFQWGHEKESSAIELYIKKLKKKHKGLEVSKSGLVVNVSWPHLGASPDGIRNCQCCAKRVIEVKSLFAKRSLPPHIAASEYLIKIDGRFHLKTETKWYYQIQGELATTGLQVADLIIYTNKGIMVVEVEFNRDLWEAMLKKLTAFYKDYLVPELLTQKIYKQLS